MSRRKRILAAGIISALAVTCTTLTVASPAMAGAPYPTPSTTGVPAGTTLTTLAPDGYTDGVPYYVVGPGEVINAKHFEGNLVISGNGAQVKNSEIYGNITNGSGHYSFSVTDTTIGEPESSGFCNGNPAILFDNYTALRVRIRSFSDAFRATTDDGSSTNSNISIKDSFAKLCSNTGDHSDGFQGWHGGGNVLIQHNTIDQRGLAAGTVTAPIFNSDNSRGIVVKDNLLAGGSYTIRVDTDDIGTTSTVQDNKVVDGAWVTGPVHGEGPTGGSSCPYITWSGNSLVTIDSSYAITSTVGPLACA
jgi:hypothetical protein